MDRLTPMFLVLSAIPALPLSAAVIQPTGFDSPSVAAAIQYASPGDTIQLSAGTYELAESLRPKSGLKILGAAQDKTRLVYRGTKAGVLVNIKGCEDLEIAQLTLDGQDNPLVHQGLSAYDSRRLKLHHLTICNLVKSDAWGPHGILFCGDNPTMKNGVTDSTIADCRIEKIGLGAEYGGGIRLAWGCVRNVIERNIVKSTGRGGIFGDHSAEIIVRNNQVSDSGGEGLGIELWGGCPRSLVEDNVIDHWLSLDGAYLSAVRRNVIGADDGSLKFLGIEIIARDVVVTDNVVKKGQHIGLSVSNTPVKNNVFWGYNTISDCVQWGAQFQGDEGGAAHHYLYRCIFEKTVLGDQRAQYKGDSGHGFRTNGSCRGLVLEDCTIRNNGGLGVQLGGDKIDAIRLLRCRLANNGLSVLSPPATYTAMEFTDCRVEGNQNNQLPPAKPFPNAPPSADFRIPQTIRAGEPATFKDTSTPADQIVDRLWDFGHGLPETAADPIHTYDRPGRYRVTLILWDRAGHGARAERIIEVLPKQKDE